MAWVRSDPVALLHHINTGLKQGYLLYAGIRVIPIIAEISSLS